MNYEDAILWAPNQFQVNFVGAGGKCEGHRLFAW